VAGWRRACAAIGLIALAFTAFTSGWSGVSGNAADIALLLLATAAVLLLFETRPPNKVRSGWLPIEGTRNQWLLATVVAGGAALLAVQSWFVAGKVMAGGDLVPPTGIAWLGRLFAPWTWSGDNLGNPSNLQQFFPLAAVMWVVHAAGGSPGLGQRVFYSLLFAGAACLAVTLAKMLGLRPVAACFAGLAFCFSAAVVSEVGTSPVYLASMVLLPAMPAIVIGVARGRIRPRVGAVFIACCGPLIGYVMQNPPLVLMTVLVIAVAVAMSYMIAGSGAIRLVLRAVIPGGVLLLAVSAYWIVPTLVQLPYTASAHLAPISSWLFTTPRDTTANAFWLNTTWAWQFTEYFPYAPAYGEAPLAFLVYVLPVLAFCGLVLPPSAAGLGAQRERLVAVLSLAALSIVFIATGVNFPGSIVFDRLYSLPSGWILREPDHLLIACGLAYALLAGLTVDALVRGTVTDPIIDRLTARKPRRLVVAAFCALVVLVPGYPLVTGQIVPGKRPILPPNHVVVPTYWQTMADDVDAQPGDGAVLVLPVDSFYQIPYKWGYYGADADFVVNEMSRDVIDASPETYSVVQPMLLQASHQTEDAILAHRWALVRDLLDSLRSPYILVREDVIYHFPNETFANPYSIAGALSSDPGVRLMAKQGPLLLFRSLGTPGTDLVRAHTAVTTSSGQPDLRVLQFLPTGAAIVRHAPIAGVPLLDQVSGSAWSIVHGRLTMTVATPPGWNYELVSLSGQKPAVAPLARPSSLLPGAVVSKAGPGLAAVSLPFGWPAPSTLDVIGVPTRGNSASAPVLWSYGAQSGDAWQSAGSGPALVVDGVTTGWYVPRQDRRPNPYLRFAVVDEAATDISLGAFGVVIILVCGWIIGVWWRRRSSHGPVAVGGDGQ
jgi:hypothetical protein